MHAVPFPSAVQLLVSRKLNGVIAFAVSIMLSFHRMVFLFPQMVKPCVPLRRGPSSRVTFHMEMEEGRSVCVKHARSSIVGENDKVK